MSEAIDATPIVPARRRSARIRTRPRRASPAIRDAVLAAVPQREPFRFVEKILELDEERVTATARFSERADFYRGHFPGNPITPGVILVEAMAQAGLVTQGLFLAWLSGRRDWRDRLFVFTDAEVEFGALVRPGARVTISARKLFHRRRKLRSTVEMRDEDGALVCSGRLSGMEIPS